MAGCVPVAIDVEALLRRVVAEVFDADTDVAYSPEQAPHVHQVRLTDRSGTRHAGLRASYEWFDATIFDLGVSTTLYDYDDEEKDKEAVLRALALVVRAYLRGEGRIEHKRGLIRSHPVLRIQVDNREWSWDAGRVGPTTPTSARNAAPPVYAAGASFARCAASFGICRRMSAMQATCSHPVADAVVPSNDFASRRLRPMRPCATSTRHACLMGRNTGCLSSHPTRRTSTWCRRLSLAAAAAVTPRSTRTRSSRSPAPSSEMWRSMRSVVRFSCVEAGSASAATGRPVTSTATTLLAPLVLP